MPLRQPGFLLLPILLSLWSTVSCAADSNPGASATPAANATAAIPPPSKGPARASRTIPSGVAPAGFYEPGTRTGVPTVDAIISAVMAHDVASLESLVEFSQVACAAHPLGVGSPPKCAGGESDAQLIQVLPGVACERIWVRPDELSADLHKIVDPQLFLYAVYRATDADATGAQFGIMFGQGLTVLTSSGFLINGQGKIVSVQGRCGQPPNTIPQGRSFLLPPTG